MYPSLGYPSEQVPVNTHVCRMLRDRRKTGVSFRARWETESKVRASLGKPQVFHPRYTSRVLQYDPNTRTQTIAGLLAGLIQSSATTLAHSDEPYIYAEIWVIHGSLDSTS